MEIIDISRTLNADTAVWPGDTPFRRVMTAALQRQDSVNLSTLTLSSHTGTHLDAPAHFAADGQTTDALPLLPYWGLAQVVTVFKDAGPLDTADFSHVRLGAAPRLLVHSVASRLAPDEFPTAFVYPTPDLAAFLATMSIILFGSDAPSMDAVDSTMLPGHHALRSHGISILEGLDLTGVADGIYELVALPLKIEGGDGSPVRAALRRLE